MQRNVPTHFKLAYIRHWPARLDQEIRKTFGDDTGPSTHFDKERKHYVTTTVHGECGADDVGPNREIGLFAAGFMAAVTMITE